MKPTLPTGLVLHCDKCNLVVPSDAPRIDTADCAFVAVHKLAWHDHGETPKARHTQATATWMLIHDTAIRHDKHPDALAYLTTYQRDPKAHFTGSAVRKAMTDDQVTEQRTITDADHVVPKRGHTMAMKKKRDAWVYEV